MSKPLLQHARPHLTVATPGSLIKHVVRMGVYWLCATMLLWSSHHPLTDWHLSTLLMFFSSSSVVVTALGYASFWLRGHDGNVTYPTHGGKTSHALAHTLTQTCLIGLELLLALTAAVAVEHLLF